MSGGKRLTPGIGRQHAYCTFCSELDIDMMLSEAAMLRLDFPDGSFDFGQ